MRCSFPVWLGTATELVNRWCNVSTFYSHEITDEYHTMNIDDLYMYSDYILRPYGFGYSPYSIDMEVKRKQFYPREYPVISVSKVLVNSCFIGSRASLQMAVIPFSICLSQYSGLEKSAPPFGRRFGLMSYTLPLHVKLGVDWWSAIEFQN